MVCACVCARRSCGLMCFCDLLLSGFTACVCVCWCVVAMGLGKCRVKSNHYFCTSLMRGRLCASVYDGKCMLVMKALLCTEACVNVSASFFLSRTFINNGVRAGLLRNRHLEGSEVTRGSPPGSHWTPIRDKSQSLNRVESWAHLFVPSYHASPFDHGVVL